MVYIDCTLEMNEKVYEKFIKNLDEQGFMLYDTGFGVIKIMYVKSCEEKSEKVNSQKELNQNLLKRIVALERKHENLISFYESHLNSNNSDIEELKKKFNKHINDYDLHKE